MRSSGRQDHGACPGHHQCACRCALPQFLVMTHTTACGALQAASRVAHACLHAGEATCEASQRALHDCPAHPNATRQFTCALRSFGACSTCCK